MGFFFFFIWGKLRELRTEKRDLLTYCGPRFGPVEGADDDKAKALILLAVDDHITGLQAVGSKALGGGGIAAGGSVVAVGIGRVVTPWGAVVRGHRAWASAILWARFSCNTNHTSVTV